MGIGQSKWKEAEPLLRFFAYEATDALRVPEVAANLAGLKAKAGNLRFQGVL
jgi:hypothetical protein